MTLRKPDQSNEVKIKMKDTEMIIENDLKHDFIVVFKYLIRVLIYQMLFKNPPCVVIREE